MSEKEYKPGQFRPGVSGNPGGIPKGHARRRQTIEQRLREAHGDDIDVIIAIKVRLAKGENVPGYEDVRSVDRLKAGEDALDRIIGKPKQNVTLDGTVTTAPVDLQPLTLEQLEVLAKLDSLDGEAIGDTGDASPTEH